MVYRIYVEKKKELAVEANSLCADIKSLLRIDALKGLRLLNRYDCDQITSDLFDKCRNTVFSEPQLDITYDELPETDGTVFAVEYLPGQFDQRADSAAQCIQIISQGDRPRVRTARIYILEGDLTAGDVAAIKKYVINPVESREASLETLETLETKYDIPTEVETINGFIDLSAEDLEALRVKLGLAMDADDIAFCRDYFLTEKRDPTITEIRMIDTYWSDHCRHTTFLTEIDNIEFLDDVTAKAYQRYLDARKDLGRTKPVSLMVLSPQRSSKKPESSESLTKAKKSTLVPLRLT